MFYIGRLQEEHANMMVLLANGTVEYYGKLH